MYLDPPSQPGDKDFCGVLICDESAASTVSGNKDPHVDTYVTFSSISKMSIFKEVADVGPKRRQILIASVTSQQPSLTRVVNARYIHGHLDTGKASLRVEFVKTGDCQAEYTCQIHGIDSSGTRTVSSVSLLRQQQQQQQPGQSGNEEDDGNAMADVTSQLLASIQQLINQSVAGLETKIGSIERSMADKIGDTTRALERSLEVKLEDTMKSAETDLKDKIVAVRNSLEDIMEEKLQSFHSASDNNVTEQLKLIESMVENKIADKLVLMETKLNDDFGNKMMSVNNDLTAKMASLEIRLDEAMADKVTSAEKSLENKILSGQNSLENELKERLVIVQNSSDSMLAETLVSIEGRLGIKLEAIHHSLETTLGDKLIGIERGLAHQMEAVERTLEREIVTKMVEIQNSSDFKLGNQITSSQIVIEGRIGNEIVSMENRLENVIEDSLMLAERNLTSKIVSIDAIGETIKFEQNASEERLGNKLLSVQNHLEDILGDKLVTLEEDFTAKVAETIWFIDTSLKTKVEEEMGKLQDSFIWHYNSSELLLQDRISVLENNLGAKIGNNLDEISQMDDKLSTTLGQLSAESKTYLFQRLDVLKKDLQAEQKQALKTVSTHFEKALSDTSSELLSSVEEDFDILKSHGQMNLRTMESETQAIREVLVSEQESLQELWNVTLTSQHDLIANFKDFESNANDVRLAFQSEIKDALADSVLKNYNDVKSALTEFMTPRFCRKGMGLLTPHLFNHYIVINPDTNSQSTTALAFPHLCDTVTDSGGWVVIQRRTTGHTDFDRVWDEYKQGFGSLDDDFWMGNDKIHAITASGSHELRIDLRYKGRTAFAHYDNFAVADESENYRLTIGAYDGTAGDSLSYHNGKEFTTLYNDNDSSFTNCAFHNGGGWWFGDCDEANLNGHWADSDGKEVEWQSFADGDSVSYSEMKIRRM